MSLVFIVLLLIILHCATEVLVDLINHSVCATAHHMVIFRYLLIQKEITINIIIVIIFSSLCVFSVCIRKRW